MAVAAYLPFVVSGHFAMFHHVWPVSAGSLPALLIGHLTNFDWPLRLVQAVVVAGGTGLASRHLRRTPELAIVLAPMVTTALRVFTDPLSFDYYWTSAGLLAVLALAISPLRTNVVATDARLLLLFYVGWFAVAVNQELPGAFAVLCLIGSCTLDVGKHARPVAGRVPGQSAVTA